MNASNNATSRRHSRAFRAVACGALLLGAVGLTSACTPRLLGAAVGAAVITAAIVGTAAILAHHDAHYHSHHCHQRRWHDGRYVYYYQGRWEYWDPYGRRWYYYRD